MFRVIFILCFLLAAFTNVHAQRKDTLVVTKDSIIAKDTTARPIPAERKSDTVKRHIPRRATIRSAIIPGWGQAYNHKYWKIPLVYTAIGIPVSTFLYNRKWYSRTREVARMLATNDTVNFKQRVSSKFYVFYDNPNYLGALTTYRNEFRRNMDYSLIFILLFWGLNVVDATVDAHLRDFDVSDKISLKVKPALFEAGTTAGISFVFTLGKRAPTSRRSIF